MEQRMVMLKKCCLLLMGNSLAMWADFTALPEGDLEIDMRALPAHANLDNMMHFTREVKKVL